MTVKFDATDDGSDYAEHYGVLRRSGRYPWGSGSTENTRNRMFLDYIAEQRKLGYSEVEIARAHGLTTSQLRAAKTIARNQQTAAQIAQAVKLRDKGMSNIEIGKKMGINESVVRDRLKAAEADKLDILNTTAAMLKDQVAEKTYVDVGAGVPEQLSISSTKLSSAVAILKEEGYTVHNVQVDQLGTGAGSKTTVKVLAPPGTTYGDIAKDVTRIRQIQNFSEDGGRSFAAIKTPLSIDPKRVKIIYAEDGGGDADGVMYIRPGKDDLSMGGANYAQVRVMVNGTHYLKGMAMYKDDLPPGVDIAFNTNKSNTGDKLDAMKPLKKLKGEDGKETDTVDEMNPFGAVVRQIGIHGPDGKLKTVTSAMNLVNEEGDWDKWSKNLSTQFLSKQAPKLAKTQLDTKHAMMKDELDEIMRLTNPVVRQKLLEGFADSADAAAVHLKAAQLPRQRTQSLLPLPKNAIKATEVYAPNFRDGERVVLVRYPHGGIFELPELTVNNRGRIAKSMLGQAQDAIGIHPDVAKKLSGADFDGDTVLVLPQNSKTKIKTADTLEGLKDFDPQRRYPEYEGMKRMTAREKGMQMGLVSNLITDMTIKGASSDELARAVRHSMVVIDAEKHKLNWKQSAEDNGISQLMRKYQGRSQGGASTLISRATSRADIPHRTKRKAAEGGPVDKETGKRVFTESGESWVDKKTGKTVFRTTQVKKLEVTDDAHTLSSGTPIERLYADHSNRLKAMANLARKAAVNTTVDKKNPSAAVAFKKEVDELTAALNKAVKNKPLERQAQIFANANVKARTDANPDMEKAELKKLKGLALAEARLRTGAEKHQIDITPRQWEAIQAGAITPSRLKDILDNADLKKVKELATPRTTLKMTSAKTQRAKAMIASGYTQAEIADALGVSLSTLKAELNS